MYHPNNRCSITPVQGGLCKADHEPTEVTRTYSQPYL